MQPARKDEYPEDTESVRSTDVDYASVNGGEPNMESGESTSVTDSDTDTEDLDEESEDEGSAPSKCGQSCSQDFYTDTADVVESSMHCSCKDASDFDILMAVAIVLEYLVCPAELSTMTVTKTFHSSQVPDVSIHEYLRRIHKYFKCSDCCILLGLVYVDRFLAKHVNFAVTRLTVHRLIFTSIVVATKFYEDSYYSNTFYAKVGGIRVKELNNQEAELLRLLDWNLKVSTEDYEQYCANLAGALPCDE